MTEKGRMKDTKKRERETENYKHMYSDFVSITKKLLVERTIHSAILS